MHRSLFPEALMVWVFAVLMLVLSVIWVVAMNGAAQVLGVYDEEERLNREADAREGG